MSITLIDDDLQETLRELHELESVIVKQFSTSPPPSSSSIERKLILLSDAVDLIPKRFPELVDQWSGKVVNLMQKFSTISNLVYADDDEETKDCISISKSQSSTSMGHTEADVVKNGEAGLSAVRYPQFAPTGSGRNSFCDKPRTYHNDSIVETSTSKETELMALESAISKMLSIHPRPTVELDLKISELMEKIGTIPAELSDKWTDRASVIMEKYTSYPEAELMQINGDGDNGLLKCQENSFDRLLQEMTNVEIDIVKNLTNISSAKSKDELEKKLYVLMEMIKNIPEKNTDVIDLWSGKVASLIQKILVSDTSLVTNIVPNLIGKISPPNGNSEGIDSLKQDLVFLESVVSVLISQNPIPVGTIEKNISKMNEIISNIPEQCFDLINQWNDKVADFKKKIPTSIIQNHLPVLSNVSPSRSVVHRLSNTLAESPSSLTDSEPPFLDRLRPELESLENDICKMLSIRPLPVSELEPKLATLGKSVAKIPSECRETANNWNKKFIYLTEKYKRIQLRAQKEGVTEDLSRLSSKSTLSTGDIRLPSVSSASNVDARPNPFVALVMQLKDYEANISKEISNGDYGHADQLMTDFRKTIFSFENLCSAEINLLNDKLADFNRKITTGKAHVVQPSSANFSVPLVNNHSAGNSLETQLNALETDISQMLSTNPRSSTIDGKLASLTELIANIPIDNMNKEMSNKWNNKAAELIQIYAAASVENVHVDLKKDSIICASNSNHYRPSSLEQDLISLETVILKLLNCQVPSISELDAKIAQFVELITKIPNDNSVLVNQWSDKVTAVMEQYVSMAAGTGCEEAIPLARSSSLDDLRLWLGMGDNDDPIEAKKPPLSPPVMQSVACPVDLYDSQPKVSNLEMIQQSSISSTLNESFNSNMTDSSYFVKPTNIVNSTVSREEVRNRIESAIKKLNGVKDNDDINGIRSLLLVAAKARKAMDPFFPDKLLHNEIFTWALAKLPDETCDLYGSTADRKNLNSLINFMRNYINDYYSDQKCLDKLGGTEVEDNISISSRSGSANGMTCNFCKLVGHRTSTCPKILNMLCFKCFEYGHGVKRCNNDELLPEMITF